MTSFDVLSPDTNVFGRYFLEASAGTGKTFAIEHIIPRLILESKEPLGLQEILVVTFTRAATRELRLRIYQNLLKIRSFLDEETGGPPYLERIRLQGEAKLYQAKQRLEEALCLFDQAEVFTLHGFCLRILQEFAFETRFFAEAEDAEEMQEEEKIKKYLKDFLRIGIDPNVISPSQLRKIIKAQKGGIESFCDQILFVLKRGDKIRSYPSAKESWMLWNQELNSLPKVTKEELWHDFLLLEPRLAKAKKRIQQVESFFTQAESKYCSFEDWDALLEEKEFFLEEIRFEKAYQKKPKEEWGFKAIEVLESLAKRFIPLHQRACDPKILFLQLVKEAKSFYDKGRLELAHFSPDDLVAQLQEALANPFFCAKLQNKYKAAIIDEFQDTDALQWDIFEKLFLQWEKSLSILYLVGDPKQSIYAFRKADVYLYLKAAKLLGENARAHLDTNFRSHPKLVEALNELFSFDLPPRWMLLPLTQESLEVRKVKSKPDYPSLLSRDEKGRIHFLIMEEEKDVLHVPSQELEDRKLFPSIAKEMIRLREEKGYTFSQMAVLVKDRFQAFRLQRALKEFYIPCSFQKNLDVKTSSAYESMKALLTALSAPKSLTALKKILGSSLMGYSAEEIEGSLENIFLQRAREYFLEGALLVQKKGFGAFFESVLLSPSRFEGKTVLEDLLSREDPHLYFELRQLLQILLENVPKALFDPEKLLEFLEEMSFLPSESDLLKGHLEEEEDQVQVMTLHKSKGLEFEIVFALGVASRHLSKEEFVFVQKLGERELAAVSDAEEAFLLKQQELDAEKLRQLYVALTRAKERVYVPVVVFKASQKIPRGAAAPIELLIGARGLFEYQFDAVYEKIESQRLEDFISWLERLEKKALISHEVLLSEESARFKSRIIQKVDLNAPNFLKRTFPKPKLLSFSSLIQDAKQETDVLSIDPKADPILPLGSQTGTVIHSILENICKADLHRPFDGRSEAVIKRFAKGSCLEGKEEELFILIERILKVPISIGQETFSLQEIPAADMHLELEFLYPFEGTFLKGFIDLLFRFRGKYYILDWKTNFLGSEESDYSLEKMHQCMLHHDYFLQATIYRSAVQKYLSLFEIKNFEKLFGGAIYFFIRGCVPYPFQPGLSLPSLLGKELFHARMP